MTELEKLRKALKYEEEKCETLSAISTFKCPVCGQRLHAYVEGGRGDALEFRAHIVCNICEMFNASSSCHSHYDNGNYENDALIDVMNKVRPYINSFVQPLDFTT